MKRANLKGFAVQGELVGPGINGNQYGLSDLDFYVFDMYQVFDTTISSYAPSIVRQEIAAAFGLKHVPILTHSFRIHENEDVQDLLTKAEGKSELNNSSREGLVFKPVDGTGKSFKVISNTWLLNEK